MAYFWGGLGFAAQYLYEQQEVKPRFNGPLQMFTPAVEYTGGYVLPDDTPDAGQTALPDDLEQAAVEQVAYWFRNRDATGLIRSWPHDGTYDAFLQSDLLLEVRAVLKKYERWTL